MKPKKRLSAGMALNPDGVDPLFEFDVTRLFVDLTQAARKAMAAAAATAATTADDQDAAARRDPWFALVHDDHSRPTEEFLAASQEQVQSRAAEHGSGRASGVAANGSQYPDGEKENLHIARPTVASAASSIGGASASGGGGAGGGASRLKRKNVAFQGAGNGGDAVGQMKATIRSVRAASGNSKAVGATKKALATTTTKLPFGNSTSASATGAVKKTHGLTSQSLPRKRPMSDRAKSDSARGHSASATTASSGAAVASQQPDRDLQDLQALLAKHNKKFKATHTYEPRQHSVRDVRMWEKQSRKSYYNLSSEDRTSANQEITQLIRARHEPIA